MINMPRAILALLIFLYGSSMLFAQESNQAAAPSDIFLSPEKVRYESGDSRSPFSSWIPKKEVVIVTQNIEQNIVPPSLSLQGLVWNTDMPQAIVDHKIVRVGDVIREAHIVAINKDGIQILYKERLFTVEMYPAPSGASKIH